MINEKFDFTKMQPHKRVSVFKRLSSSFFSYEYLLIYF